MDSNIKITPTSSTTTMARSVSTQPSSLSSEKSKYGFRQQLKRFVGWGTSASKPKKPLLTPLTTHALDNASTPLTGSTLVSSSDMSFVSAPSTPLPPTPGTPHSIVLKSRLAVVDSRRTSEVTSASEVAMSVISKSRLSTVSSISTCSVTTEDLSTQEKVYISDSEDDSDDDDDSDDAVSAQEDIVVEKEEDEEEKEQKQVNQISNEEQEQQQVSNVQDEQQQTTNQNGEIKNVQDTNSIVESSSPSQILTEQIVPDTTNKELQTPTQVTATPPPPPPKTGGAPGEFNDIQAQYAMWMNSQPPEAPSPFAQLPPTPASSIHHSPVTTAAAPAAAPTVPTATTTTTTTTAKNVLKNKPSVISEKSITTAPSMINSSSSSSSGSSSSSSSSTCSGITTLNKQKQETPREYQEPLHPMSSNNEQDIDDLFLLVAHGVEFLTIKENTKWEEEGGYEFHPWNRPHSSFAVRHHHKKSGAGNAKKQLNGVPVELTQTNAVSREQEITKEGEEVVDEKQELHQEEGVDINHQDDHPLEDEENQEELASLQDAVDVVEEETTSQESLVSVAKRILGAKSEPQPTQTSFNSVSNEHPSLDDDELQRIVAAHIVF